MNSVLISIQPYWVFLIIAKQIGWDIGKKKTLEVRKNFPKAETWDRRVFIYCSKDKKSFRRIPKKYQPLMKQFLGKVIGEFVCDSVVRNCEMANADIAEQQGYIKREKLLEYSNGKELFGWHISDLKIYDKPKNLSEFRNPCQVYIDGTAKCGDCNCYYCANNESYREEYCVVDGLKPITRPPQSWCYIARQSLAVNS